MKAPRAVRTRRGSNAEAPPTQIVVAVAPDANSSGRRPPGRSPLALEAGGGLSEASPLGVSPTEPVTLKGPPNSFCSALSEGSHFSSVLEILAPNDMLVSVGKTLNRSDWLAVQPWLCVVALGSGLVTA